MNARLNTQMTEAIFRTITPPYTDTPCTITVLRLSQNPCFYIHLPTMLKYEETKY